MAKYTKEEAGYKAPRSPTGILDTVVAAFRNVYRCERCAHFVKTGGCEIVEGPISPTASCNFWSLLGFRPLMQK